MRFTFVHTGLVMMTLGVFAACGDDATPATADTDVVDASDLAPADLMVPVGAKRIFISATAFNGDLGGPSGADAKCQSDARAPSGGTFKAMLAGGARRACTTPDCTSASEQQDWVFAANTSYVRLDGQPLFTSSSNGLVASYPLANDLGSAINFWAGLEADWTGHAESCAGWTSSSGELRGRVGWGAITDKSWIQGGNFTCADTAPLVCVEQ